MPRTAAHSVTATQSRAVPAADRTAALEAAPTVVHNHLHLHGVTGGHGRHSSSRHRATAATVRRVGRQAITMTIVNGALPVLLLPPETTARGIVAEQCMSWHVVNVCGVIGQFQHVAELFLSEQFVDFDAPEGSSVLEHGSCR